jgi:hypothetical protein
MRETGDRGGKRGKKQEAKVVGFRLVESPLENKLENSGGRHDEQGEGSTVSG